MSLYNSNSSRSRVSTTLVASCLALYMYGVIFFASNSELQRVSNSGEVESIQKSNPVPNFDKWENCTISFSPPARKEEWDTKPILFPAQPGTMGDDLLKPLINQLTGLDAGAKSYYASSKAAKKCIGKTETAACILGHTFDNLNDRYNGKIVLVTRNPKFVFPAGHNLKAIKYHGATGQVPIEEWRTVREEWFDHATQEWREFLNTWKNTGYEVGMYLSYEQLMDSNTGPQTLQQLSELLQQEGFTTASEEDIPCIWYQSIGRQKLENYFKYNYDYTDYVPSYTRKQQDELLGILSSMIEKYEQDEKFLAILKSYHDFLLQDKLIDT